MLPDLSEPPAVPRVQITATPYRWIAPNKLPRREWLYGRHLIRKYLSGTIAAGGVGKSTLVVGENLELSSGHALVSDHRGPPLRVWYWNGEDPYDEIQRRVQAACLHYKIEERELGGRLFVDTGRRTPIVIAHDLNGDLKIAQPVVDDLKATIGERKIDVFRVDPFVSCHRVSENDNNKIDAVAAAWGNIAEEMNCSIELVHHIRKTSGEVTPDDARGASALINRGRSIRVLNRMTAAEAETAGVDNRLLYFRIGDGKVNLAPPSEAAAWCKLESVSLGNGDMGGPADVVGVATRWRWPDPLEGVTVDDLKEVQRRLVAGTYRADPRAKEWAGNMVAEVLGWDPSDATVKKSIQSALKKWGATGAIREVTSTDSKRNRRKFLEKGNSV